jgi:hypothetical protein
MKKKLAELLIDRKDLSNRLNVLTLRLHNAVIAPKESAGPVEEFRPLLDEFMTVSRDYSKVDGLIAKANQQAKVVGPPAETIADAIIARDLAKRRMALFASLAQATGETNQRRYREETPMVAVVPVTSLQAQVDVQSKIFRELDVAIQQANWSTELTYDE